MKDYYDGSKSFSSYIVDCPYKNKCTNANSFKCWSCRHNKGKKDYYEPEPYRPYQPPWTPEPFRPIWIKSSTTAKNTPRFAD